MTQVDSVKVAFPRTGRSFGLKVKNPVVLSRRMSGDPRSGSKVRKAPDREIGKPGENRGQVVAHWEFQSAAAFDDRKGRRNPRSRLWTANVYSILPAQCHGTHRVLCQVLSSSSGYSRKCVSFFHTTVSLPQRLHTR